MCVCEREMKRERERVIEKGREEIVSENVKEGLERGQKTIFE